MATNHPDDDLRRRLIRRGLVQRLIRRWRAFRKHRSVGHGIASKTVAVQENMRRAEARRRFWAEVHAGRLEAESRCSK